MVELELNKIKIDESRNEQLIVFREKAGTRFLPLMIGISEIQAIKLKLSGMQPPRPLTHDLYVNTVEALGAKADKVVIDKIQNNTFFAKLFLIDKNQQTLEIDARPSDCVAIAVRCQVPVFVTDEVLGQAAVTTI